MARRSLLLILISLFFSNSSVFGQKFGFDKVLRDNPDQPTAFCIPRNDANIKTLNNQGITVKYSSSNWLFITATPKWISDNLASGAITDFYFEYAPPKSLADTARMHHFVDQVHSGLAPLESSYTGANVIVGIVDQGLDHTHLDFKDAQGRTRVLRYWDHNLSGNAPQPYGYGYYWDSTAINSGAITSNEETTAHGTTVAGMAAGNGLMNGQHKGMAPDANIIIVETNFNLPNWSLTIADAVDFIFKTADTLGMPAVVNLSLGSYFGSHDAKDPAGQIIESLLDAEPGRIVVSAAGNSGAQGKYHVHNEVDTDTSFVWLLNNPGSVLGANTIFFDLWSDQSEATWDFALGADSPSYSFRGRTAFHAATQSPGTVFRDTIWNGSNRIATFEAYTSISNGNYNLQLFVDNVDSTTYNYRFETKGSGSYDLWTGQWLGYNNLVTNIPTPGQMPDIVDYVMPDSLQTIVSSWNCSDKVVSVGNMRSMLGFVDDNLNVYTDPSTDVGDLSPNSSKGPSRQGSVKPDVAAAGDMTFGSAPQWVITNPSYAFLRDSGGYHVLNGGTSMASPVVAGIAALYLERCRYATWEMFKADLITTAYSNSYTGTLPNFAFGHGLPNAHTLLQEQTLETQPVISYVGGNLQSTHSSQYQWILDGSNISGETAQDHAPQPPYGSYEVMTINNDGCYNISNPLDVGAGLIDLNEKILLWPNPSNGNFTLPIDKSVERITAVDLRGRNFNVEQTGAKTFQLVNAAAGTYIIKYVIEGIEHRGKLIIEL